MGPTMGVGSPCSVPSPLVEAAVLHELVLLMGWKGLRALEPSLPPQPPERLDKVLELQAASGRLPGLYPLRRAVEAGVVRRVVYLDVDGVLARMLGDAVLDVYGSRGRLRCDGCGGGRRWMGSPSDRMCGCGVEGVEDYVAVGGRPSQRVLAEAVYEVTSARAVVLAGMPYDAIGSSLALLAAKYTLLYLPEGEEPPGWLEPGYSRLDCSLAQLLGMLLARAAGEESQQSL